MKNAGDGIATTPNFKHPVVTTSFNAGFWVPILSMEYVPNTRIKKIRVPLEIRKTVAKAPTYGRLVVTTAAFSVSDLLFDKAKEYYGEQKNQYDPNKARPLRAKVYAPVYNPGGSGTIGWNKGSVGDHLNYMRQRKVSFAEGDTPKAPFNVIDGSRYALICNEWLINPNLQNYLVVAQPFTDNGTSYEGVNAGVNGDYGYIETATLLGDLCPSNKRADRFTLCTLRPQQSDDIIIPGSGEAGVYTSDSPNAGINNSHALEWYRTDNGEHKVGGNLGVSADGSTFLQVPNSDSKSGAAVVPGNLKAHLNQGGIDVKAFRDSYHKQLLEEAVNRLGTRYRERNQVFGIQDRNVEDIMPMLLGIQDTDLDMQQIIQNSQGDDKSPLGNVAGLSRTNKVYLDLDLDWVPKTHGAVMILLTVRCEQSYNDGTPRHLLIDSADEQYNPMLANISDQPVYKGEICQCFECYGDLSTDVPFKSFNKDVFGYMPAWDEYKFEPNRASGEMRAMEDGSLGKIYTYNNDVSVNIEEKGEQNVYLNEQFILQKPEQIDQTLTATHDAVDQFLLYGNVEIYEDLPMGSNLPSLAPHS